MSLCVFLCDLDLAMIVRFPIIFSMKIFTLNDFCNNNRTITWTIHVHDTRKLNGMHRSDIDSSCDLSIIDIFLFGFCLEECIHCRCINRFSQLYLHCLSRLKNYFCYFFFGFYINFVLKFDSLFYNWST